MLLFNEIKGIIDNMTIDKQRFDDACDTIIGKNREKCGIGTLGEKTLHAVLKQYFELQTEKHEIKIGRYVADIVSENEIIEIQTQGFNNLRKKLESFLDCMEVTVVYPIPKTKWLCWIDEKTGEITKKRKSPKVGTIYNAFYELYKIKHLLTNPNLHFCFVMLELTEYRFLNGWSTDKKRGSSRYDRVPNNIIEEIYIYSTDDYIKFLPENLPPRFTTKDYAKATKLNIKSSQTALNVLHYIGIVKRVGKTGHMHLYEKS